MTTQRYIEFRGKFGDDDWEYGGLRYGDMGQAYILPHGATHIIELVNRDTVGQYTGLLDKNGKKIFEGDILLIEDEKIAEYIGRHAQYEPDNRIEAVKFVNGSFFTKTDLLYEEHFECEIIGNVYENKDLLDNK